MNETGEDSRRVGWSYSGEVWTDGDGCASVALPPFVRVHRAGFDYVLSPVGPACSAVVTQEIRDGRFAIRTGRPHVKVAWRVTAFREEA